MSDMQLVSIITPAYHAEKTIIRTVSSVIAQTYPYWEILIIADDGADYEAILAEQGVRDTRIRFLSTDGIAVGHSRGRNIGLKAARGDIAAALDADDTFAPEKLERCLPMLDHAPVVTCGLELVSAERKYLRNVGTGIPPGLINARTHMFNNFSSGSMLLLNRKIVDSYYDETMSCMVDHDFLLQCFGKTSFFYHIAEPLQHYYKQPNSVTNGVNAHRRFSAAKQNILERLAGNYYTFAEPSSEVVFRRFYEISLHAEKEYEMLLKTNPAVLFEDIIEPMLQQL